MQPIHHIFSFFVQIASVHGQEERRTVGFDIIACGGGSPLRQALNVPTSIRIRQGVDHVDDFDAETNGFRCSDALRGRYGRLGEQRHIAITGQGITLRKPRKLWKAAEQPRTIARKPPWASRSLTARGSCCRRAARPAES